MSDRATTNITRIAALIFVGSIFYLLDYGPDEVQAFKTPLWILLLVLAPSFYLLRFVPSRLSGRLATPKKLPASKMDKLYFNDRILRYTSVAWIMLLYGTRLIWIEPNNIDLRVFWVYLACTPLFISYLWRWNVAESRASAT